MSMAQNIEKIVEESIEEIEKIKQFEPVGGLKPFSDDLLAYTIWMGLSIAHSKGLREQPSGIFTNILKPSKSILKMEELPIPSKMICLQLQ